MRTWIRSAEAHPEPRMNKPADPATPLHEVYQSFLDDLAMEG